MSSVGVYVPAARRTLAGEAVVEGVGIHTGALARVRVRPAAEPGAGILFLSGGDTIAARAGRVADTSRCTVLAAEGGGVTVSTVEHLLSALAGLGVTDAVVEVDGPELPIGDGSALLWVEAVRAAGVRDLGPVPALTLAAPLLVTGKGGAFVAAYPADVLRATVAVSFDHPLVGTQVARFDASRDDYAAAVAPARTFGFIEEVEALLAAGLARGGSFDNAVVVYPDRYSSPLRFADELARHKLLDLLGDLSLATGGAPLPPMDLVAVKPSHRLNTELAARLSEALSPSGTMA